MINKDYSRDKLITPMGHSMLKQRWMKEGEDSPQDAFERTVLAYCKDLSLAQRVYDYVSKGWAIFSSPVISNAPAIGETFKGLPISCFLSYVPNSIKGLTNHQKEFCYLSVKGGGVAGHWSDVETVNEKAPGPVPFIHCVDSAVLAYSQGRTRRGAYAAYMNVDHPDIEEFIDMRIPTGDIQRKNMNLHHGINIPNHFMQAVINDEDYDLIDPEYHHVVETLSARRIWIKILEARSRAGEPYLHFIDHSNAALPLHLKQAGYEVRGSNLCTEIMLPTAEEHTAVCCLSSVNAEYFDEWKDTNIIQDMTVFLDNVMQAFIDFAPPELAYAVRGASEMRPLGLGCMGFHSYLQKNKIPITGFQAYNINNLIFKTIKERAVEASQIMAKVRGEYPAGQGTGMRNSHLIAVAPNVTTATIFGCTLGIEPDYANIYAHNTDIGIFEQKNKYLERDLEAAGINTEETWANITENAGSVSELDFPEKDVYLTAMELDQRVLVNLAAGRQPYICQGQSLNLCFPQGSDRGYVNQTHIMAWKRGLKSVYYFRSRAAKNAKQIGLKLKAINPLDDADCESCSG